MISVKFTYSNAIYFRYLLIKDKKLIPRLWEFEKQKTHVGDTSHDTSGSAGCLDAGNSNNSSSSSLCNSACRPRPSGLPGQPHQPLYLNLPLMPFDCLRLGAHHGIHEIISCIITLEELSVKEV